MPGLIVSTATAIRLRELLRRKEITDPNKQGNGEISRIPLLVRCTSATAAGGSGVSAECYPAKVVDPDSTELVADQPELGDVWLTVMDEGGAAVPTADKEYFGLMSGEHTEGSDTRPRVFATVGDGGSTTIAHAEAAMSVDCNISADNTKQDTGLFMSIAAGTYLLYAVVTGHAAMTVIGTAPSLYAELWNDTDGSVIAGDDFATALLVSSNNFIAVMPIITVVTFTGTKTVKVRAMRRNNGGTWSASRIQSSAFANGTRMGWIRLG